MNENNTTMTPREIVQELDRHIVGQHSAKRAVAIASGGSYALSAARALLAHTALDAKSIAAEAPHIAGDICIYTNRNVVVEEL